MLFCSLTIDNKGSSTPWLANHRMLWRQTSSVSTMEEESQIRANILVEIWVQTQFHWGLSVCRSFSSKPPRDPLSCLHKSWKCMGQENICVSRAPHPMSHIVSLHCVAHLLIVCLPEAAFRYIVDGFLKPG